MGSSRNDVQYVQAPAAPSVNDTMQQYVQSLPALYQAQMQYEPQMQQMNLDMLQQFGTQYGQAQKAVNDAMYPETSALQEQIAQKASTGMNEQMPAWAQDAYKSGVNANLGTNVGSPMGADYASRGMMEQQKGWNDYYTNLGLSAAGRQPLAQGGTTPQTNYMQQYQPAQAMNYNANTYSSYAQASSPFQSNVPVGGVNLGIFGQWGAR